MATSVQMLPDNVLQVGNFGWPLEQTMAPCRPACVRHFLENCLHLQKGNVQKPQGLTQAMCTYTETRAVKNGQIFPN